MRGPAQPTTGAPQRWSSLVVRAGPPRVPWSSEGASLSNTSASKVHLGSCGAGLIDFRPDEEQPQFTITETYPSLSDMKRRLHVDKEK